MWAIENARVLRQLRALGWVDLPEDLQRAEAEATARQARARVAYRRALAEGRELSDELILEVSPEGCRTANREP